jgi:hypothetical protein
MMLLPGGWHYFKTKMVALPTVEQQIKQRNGESGVVADQTKSGQVRKQQLS